jgi:hypothetical protein
MTIRDDLLSTLTGDATLMATLTGGMHTATEVSRQYTPAAFDANGEVLPCGLLRIETETPAGPYHTSARLFALLLWYQRRGYDAIDAAKTRAFTLLHELRLAGTWQVMHADDLGDAEDEALGCSLSGSRFVVYRLRGAN